MSVKVAPNIEIRDEGASQGFVRVVDFVGAGVSAAVASGVATVTIPGGGGGGGSDPPEGSYAPGSYTIATGKFRLAAKRQEFTTTQRLTIQGTGRLSLSN